MHQHPWGNKEAMNTPDPALQTILRQLSMETGLSISVIHPGSLSGDHAAEAFSGLHDGHIERLRRGEPSLSIETDDVLREIDREVSCAVISSVGRRERCGAWAAFFEPDGTVDIARPLSGMDRVREPAL